MVLNYIDGGGGTVDYPDDLNKNNKVKTGQDYFTVPVVNLKINEKYSFNFRWVYPDGKVGPWSDGLSLTTASIPTQVPPQFLNTDLTYFNGILNITWNGKDANGNVYTKAFDRINVYVKNESEIGSVYRFVGSLRAPGTLKVPVPPQPHSVKLTVVSVDGVESNFSTAQFEIPKIIPNTLPTSVAASWTGTNFKVSWNHNPAEEFFSYYRVTLTSGLNSKVYDIPATPGTSAQSFTLSLSQNRAAFGVLQTSFSGSVKTINIFENAGSEVTFNNVSYANTLPAATIVATPISNGYSVSYTTPTDATFDKIEIEEVESSSATAPTTGFAKIFSGSSNPAIVIVPNTNKRWVRARFVSNIGSFAAYGSSVQVEPTSPVVVDNAGPDNVTSVTVVSGIDNSGYLGFNAYADITWSAVTGGGIRGYRVRFSNDNNTTFSYVDSPGSGTTYRLAGLAIGATYKIAVATYDEYNNLSSAYVAGPNVLVTGTPAVTNYITGGPFQFGVGVGAPLSVTQFAITNNGVGSYSVNGVASQTLTLTRGVTYVFNVNAAGHPFYIQTSGNGYNAANVFSTGVSLVSGTRDSGTITFQVPQAAPDTLYYQCQLHPAMYGQINVVSSSTNNKGLYFDNSNYWYLNATNSARLKVGGSSSNYLLWDGSEFVIDGNLSARKGTFRGNVEVISGGSLYSGSLTAQGALNGAGYILNTSGLTFNSASINGITTINASNGLLTTASANIGGWNVDASTIKKVSNSGTITLDSSNAQIIVSSSSYTAGVATPNTNSPTDIVFWSGGARDTNANFYVQANGTVVMKSAVITGYASNEDIPSIAGLAKTDMSNVTIIDGGKITTGVIKSYEYSGVLDGSTVSTNGTAINLATGAITSKKFRINAQGDAFFTGTLSAGTSMSSPVITGGTIGGAKLVVNAAFASSGLVAFNDSGLEEETDTGGGGNNSNSASTNQTSVTIESGKIIARSTETYTGADGNLVTLSGQSGVLRLEGENFVELFAGGTQSAMFDTTKSSMTFTTGLYLGNPNTSSSSAIQNHTTPYVTIDARMRLRRGAPLRYPGGTAGAYVRNIYIKQSTNTPASTTGYTGDIFITY